MGVDGPCMAFRIQTRRFKVGVLLAVPSIVGCAAHPEAPVRAATPPPASSLAVSTEDTRKPSSLRSLGVAPVCKTSEAVAISVLNHENGASTKATLHTEVTPPTLDWSFIQVPDHVLRRLRHGLRTTFVVSASIKDLKDQVVSSGRFMCEATWDVWDEVYRLHFIARAPRPDAVAPTTLSVVRSCLTGTAVRFDKEVGADPVRLVVRFDVDPVLVTPPRGALWKLLWFFSQPPPENREFPSRTSLYGELWQSGEIRIRPCQY